MLDSRFNDHLSPMINSPYGEDYNSYANKTTPAKELKSPMVSFPKYTPPNASHCPPFVPYYPYMQPQTGASSFARTWFTITPTSITNTNETIGYTHLRHRSQDAPLPPSNFVGIFKKNKVANQVEYILEATWRASRSTSVILYRIFKNGELVDEIAASGPLLFSQNIGTKDSIQKYTIVSVNENNIESMPIKLKVIPI